MLNLSGYFSSGSQVLSTFLGGMNTPNSMPFPSVCPCFVFLRMGGWGRSERGPLNKNPHGSCLRNFPGCPWYKGSIVNTKILLWASCSKAFRFKWKNWHLLWAPASPYQNLIIARIGIIFIIELFTFHRKDSWWVLQQITHLSERVVRPPLRASKLLQARHKGGRCPRLLLEPR